MCVCVRWPSACSFLLQIYSSLNALHRATFLWCYTFTHALPLWLLQTTNSVFNAEQKQLTGCGISLHHSFLFLSISITTAYCVSLKYGVRNAPGQRTEAVVFLAVLAVCLWE